MFIARSRSPTLWKKPACSPKQRANTRSPPKWSIITYQFQKRGDLRPAKFVWYDGGKKPKSDLVKGRKLEGNGVILVGDKDTLYVPSYWGKGEFLSGAKYEDFQSIPETLPKA